MPFKEDETITCDKCHETFSEGNFIVCDEITFEKGNIHPDHHEHGELTYCPGCFEAIKASNKESLSEEELKNIWESLSPATKNAYKCWIRANIFINNVTSDNYELKEDPSSSSITKFVMGDLVSDVPSQGLTFYCAICKEEYPITNPTKLDLSILNHLLTVHPDGEYESMEDTSAVSSLSDYKRNQLIEIHNYLSSEERRQAVHLAQEYGLYDFFSDYALFLKERFSLEEQHGHFKDMTISFMRITNK